MTDDKIKDLLNSEIIPFLPYIFGIKPDDALPKDLAGSTIKQVGTFKDQEKVCGGGIVIDYCPYASTEVKRIVIECSESGAWIIAQTNQ